jgi:ABC-type amino acid transport substrate-binding protein
MIGRNLLALVSLLCLVCNACFAQTPKLRSPLIIATKEAPPFAMKGADGKWHGIGIELWQDMAARLKLNYTFKEMPLEQLLAGMTNGSLDAAIAAISVTANRESVMDFTQPYYTTGLCIAVATHDIAPWLGVLKRLLSWQFLTIVSLLTLLLLGVGFLVWLFERRANAEQFGGKPWTGIGSGFWWSAVTMTTVGYGDKAPRTLGGRIVGLIWMFAAIIIISSFTAAITSALTVGQLGSSIRGPSDLPNVRVAGVTGSTGEFYLKHNHISFISFSDAATAMKALADKKVEAVVYDAPILQYLAKENYPGKIMVLPHTFVRQDYAIALPQGSSLREPLDLALEGEIHAPAWQDLLYRYLGDAD